MTPQGASLVVAGGAVALTLYNRGVWQAAIAALKGNPLPVQSGTAISGGSTIPANVPPSGTFGGGLADALTNNRLSAAEAAVTAEGPPGGGGDWLDWCLNWVNRVRGKLQLPTGVGTPYGAATAQDACDQLSLTKGIAPSGATVCFSDNHVGLSNGNCQYTSVGISHGGPQTLDYCNNPAYIGYSR